MIPAMGYYWVLVYRRWRRERSPDFQATMRVQEQARELAKTDPGAAERLMENHFMEQGRKEDDERRSLRQLAPTDAAAAADLRRRLEDDLKTDTFARAQMAQRMRGDPKLAEILRQIDESTSNTKRELADLDMQTRGQHRLS